MGVVPRFGGPSGDCTVRVVAGVAAWGVSLELLTKGTVLEKSDSLGGIQDEHLLLGLLESRVQYKMGDWTR